MGDAVCGDGSTTSDPTADAEGSTVNAELDLLVRLGDYDRPQGVAERAVQAEELGFDRITVGETTGWNIVPPLTLAAERTEELGISNDVISPYGRTPSMLAQTALTMQDVADGRFRFGIGPSSPAITERWHGQEFDRPLRRTREVIDVMRNVYEEGNPAYDGEIFDIPGLGYERGPHENPPPIDVGTLGPKATEMAGRFGDGWAPQLFTKDGLRERLRAEAPEFSVSVDAPETLSRGESPTFDVAVTNDSAVPGRLVAGLNRYGPRVASTPAKRFSMLVDAGATERTSYTGDVSGYHVPDDELGDGEQDLRYRWNGADRNRTFPIEYVADEN
jgi:alkanesulfonate monooxygenase SsuD/methylene tetrahydromethanopterin reductase-like flavin-dependent oxidoreductase (luciferase family)